MQNLTLEEMIAEIGDYPKEQNYQENLIKKSQRDNTFHKSAAFYKVIHNKDYQGYHFKSYEFPDFRSVGSTFKNDIESWNNASKEWEYQKPFFLQQNQFFHDLGKRKIQFHGILSDLVIPKIIISDYNIKNSLSSYTLSKEGIESIYKNLSKSKKTLKLKP